MVFRHRIAGWLLSLLLCFAGACSSDPDGISADLDGGEATLDGALDTQGDEDLSLDPLDDGEVALDPLQDDGEDPPLDEDADLTLDDSDGDDPEDEPELPPCPEEDALIEPAVGGWVYFDGDDSADSFYSPVDEDEDLPLPEVPVTLIGPEDRSTTTCPSGWFSFGAVEEGTYVVQVEADPSLLCTSTNQPRRFPEAIQEGAVTILTLGDSIPVYGPAPHFPARLADLLTPLAEVNDVNVAVAGTTTEDWLPDSSRYRERVEPNLADADVIVISLGGNDIVYYFEAAGETPEEMLAAADAFPEFQTLVEDNLLTLLAALQTSAPQADIVYLIYPNYGHSTYWEEAAGEWIALVISTIDRALNRLRGRMSTVPGIVLADMYSATIDEDLDAFLSDPLHLSEAGTVFWAREIFQALGGVIVGEAPLGWQRMVGFNEGATE